MLKSYGEFLNEGIKFTDTSSYYARFEVSEISNLKELQEKTKLKKGDSLKFTGSQYMLRCEVLPASPKDKFSSEIIKGEKINEMNLVFERWVEKKDVEKFAKLDPTSYDWGTGYDKPMDHEKMMNAFLGICKDEKGKEHILSFFTYNPKYVKSEPKVPEVFKKEEMEAICEKLFREMGIESWSVNKKRRYHNGKFTELYEVDIDTWFVYVRDHKGDAMKVAGPFGKKETAEKRMKELGSTKGDIDYDLMGKLKFRVDAKESPATFFVSSGTTSIPDLEFTRTLKKNYDTGELLKMLRGAVAGKKFGI
jgi:hypothetical protein